MSDVGIHYVYFAGCCDLIKIGYARKPHERLLQVSQWIPYPITLLATMPGGLDTEAALHRMFDHEFSHGEWFHASIRLREFVAEVAAGRPVVIEGGLADNRQPAVTDKMRYAKRLGKCCWYGTPEHTAFKNLLPAEPIPDELRAKLDAILEAHGRSFAQIPIGGKLAPAPFMSATIGLPVKRPKIAA